MDLIYGLGLAVSIYRCIELMRNRNTDANLMIHFGVEECGLEGIEVNFFQMRKIIVSNYGEKAKFLTAPVVINAIDQTLETVKVWFLFDKGKPL